MDEAALRPAVLAWMGSMFGSDDLPVETVDVGGKDVLSVDVSPELHMYIYVIGDEFFLLNLPETEAARVFETLP